ncbi:hypothetical protein OR221_2004 [Microbacterium laevaniformans OR221]|nr:hypothetical protein OR221_2004 [Microbacterium laevaniformans OR221]
MAEPSGQQQSYLGVAIAFFAIAVSMGLTMHNWTVALPFGVLAVFFFFLGRRPAPDEDDDDNSDGTS